MRRSCPRLEDIPPHTYLGQRNGVDVFPLPAALNGALVPTVALPHGATLVLVLDLQDRVLGSIFWVCYVNLETEKTAERAQDKHIEQT